MRYGIGYRLVQDLHHWTWVHHGSAHEYDEDLIRAGYHKHRRFVWLVSRL